MRVAVVGGGVAGGVFALLAARRGHQVVVVDRDPPPPDGGPAQSWTSWERRSVPQFRQLHGYQAHAYHRVRSLVPELLDGLLAAGGVISELVPGNAELVQFRCRRATLEWVLRQAVAERVELRPATEALGIVVGPDGRAAGVRTAHGDVPADLVVDASGRRSRAAAWCADAGLPVPVTEAVPTEQVYYTRWFRRRADLPPTHARVELSFAALMMVSADDGWVSVTLFAPAGDAELRQVLLDPARFAAAVGLVPPVAALIEAGAEPHGDVLFMGGLHNAISRPVPDAPASGLVRLADAAMCTNPTWGRGVALAIDHAGLLDEVLADEPDPAVAQAAFERRSAEQLEPWFDDTVRLDVETNAAWAKAPEPKLFGGLSHSDVLAAARVDPAVGLAYIRYRNLLDRPDEFWGSEEVAARVQAALAAGAPSVLDQPSRADVLAVSGAGR